MKCTIIFITNQIVLNNFNLNCKKLIFFGFYEKIFFVQGVTSVFRYLYFSLLLPVCLGLFVYCVPSLYRIQLGSSGVDGGGSGEDYEDYEEGDGSDDLECEEDDDEDCDVNNVDEDVDEMEMPYDIQMDTASYLTCDSRDLPDDTFIFKFEALRGGESGGVRLRPKFRNMEKNEIKRYPYYRSYPVLLPIPPRWWVSPLSNIQNPVQSRLLSLPSVELEGYLDDFLANGKSFTNNFGRDIIQLGWSANASVGNHALASSLHTLFENSYLLVSYRHTGRGSSLLGYRDSDNSRETTHGRYYRIDMEEEEQNYTLDRITERYPRVGGSREVGWSCGLKFKVRRHDNHRYLGESLSEERSCENNDDGSKIYEIARQVLGDDWNINPGERCISLRSHRKSCYRFTRNPQQINDGNRGKGRVDHSGDCDGSQITGLCPHYLSICTR